MKKLILLLTFSTSLINASIERLLTNPNHMEYWEEFIEESSEGTMHTFRYKVCEDPIACYVEHKYYCRKAEPFRIIIKSDICEVFFEKYKQPALLPLTRIKEIFSYTEIYNIMNSLRYEIEWANMNSDERIAFKKNEKKASQEMAGFTLCLILCTIGMMYVYH